MKNIPNAMKFSASLLIINMIFETADLGSKLKAWAHLISKLNAPDFLKFGNQNKSNTLIMNILIVIDDLDRKFPN